MYNDKTKLRPNRLEVQKFENVFQRKKKQIKLSAACRKCLRLANESLPVVVISERRVKSSRRNFVHLLAFLLFFQVLFADNWSRLCGLLQQLFMFYFM